MKIKVLASGSKGNSTYIESENTKILIDVGINYQTIKRKLSEINVDINDIDGIIISHVHSDHIKGLRSIIKNITPPIYIKKELKSEVKTIVSDEYINIIDDNLKINDLYVKVLSVSHDVPNYGFVISDDNESIVYITDTGYINKRNFELTKNKTLYIIEANHNEKMLMEGKYPYMLKQRVLSDQGHLSNRYTGRYLNSTIGNNTKYIILAHLSENNNTKDLALTEVKEELIDNNFSKDNILIASQDNGSELVCI